MHQIITAIIVLFFIILTFVPLTYLQQNNMDIESTKQALNLSVKVLPGCIERQEEQVQELARGAKREPLSEVRINRQRLLEEFYGALKMNTGGQEGFDKIKDNILAKILVYYDRFYAADVNDRWSAPFFFTDSTADKLVYVNIKDDTAYYFDDYGMKVNTTIQGEGISKKEKTQIVIDKLNSTISQYTHEKGLRNGLEVKFYNPYEEDVEYRVKNSYFSVLDGITFFVLYADNKRLGVDKKEFNFRNYNVVGYTVE